MSSKESKDMSDDEESIGSLKDFIVDDTEDGEIVSDDASEDASEAEEATEGRAAKKAKIVEDLDVVDQLVSEAKAFAANIQGTTVNGRTLRSRDPKALESRKPKDEYYERFGRDAEAKLLEKFTKKDIIEFVKDLEKENRAAYEAAGNTWPKLHARMSLDTIQEEYQKIKDFLDLPDSDGEESVDSEDESSEADAESSESEDAESDDESDAEAESDEDCESEDSSDGESEDGDSSDGESSAVDESTSKPTK